MHPRVPEYQKLLVGSAILGKVPGYPQRTCPKRLFCAGYVLSCSLATNLVASVILGWIPGYPQKIFPTCLVWYVLSGTRVSNLVVSVLLGYTYPASTPREYTPHV